MQQRTTGSLDTPGAMPDPFKQPTEYLLAFLNRIAMLDKEGFFQRPVREEEAPNYYSIIKQPMCFADMREKIAAGLYQTWRQLRDDFNLIHENARRFNSNKTLVHRAALNLQKNGNKVLANYELEVRKAIAVLHPLGAQQAAGQAAGAQAPASSASATVTEGRMDIATSPIGTATVSGLLQAPEQNGEGMGLDAAVPRTSMSGPPSPEGGVDGAGLPMTGSGPTTGKARQPFPAILLPPAPRDPLVGYISDEDDQPLLVVGTDAAAATAAAAASRSLPGLGPSHALPLDALLSQLRTAAVRIPYSCPKRQKGDGRGGGGGGASSAEGAAQGAAGQSTIPVPSQEWRQARRPVELRARWLELRMRELRSQQERLQTQINWLQQRKAAGEEGIVGNALNAGLGRPAVGLLAAAAGLAAAPCGAEREALVSAAGEFMSAGRVSSSLYFRLRPSTQGPAAAASPLVNDVSTPVAQTDAPADPPQAAGPNAAVRCDSDRQLHASGSGVSDSGASGRSEELCRTMPPPKPPSQPGQPQAASLRQSQSQQGPGRPAVQPLPLLPQQLPPCDEGESDKMLSGAIFASLELLEQRLSVVRARLQDTYKFDPTRLAVGRTHGPCASRVPSYQLASSGSLATAGAPGTQMLPSGPLAGHEAVKRQSSGQGRRPGSLTVLTRFDSMGLPSCKSTGTGGKRKRSEVELLAGDIGTPLASYGRTSLDRSASVTAIVIPPVRELGPDEFRARIVAATTWSQHYHTTGPAALDTVPPEIQVVLRKRRRRGLCASGEEYDEDMGMGPGAGRGVLSTSDDEGGAVVGGGVGGGAAAIMGAYSDSGAGDDEGSSSSSEDTSDEAYAARHRIMEEEEHRRYAAVVAEGQRRRNKGGSNASGGQQNQANMAGGGAAASQAKERAKVGNKTPRYSSSFKLKEGLTLVSPELQVDGPDSAPPSATYGHYQPYQPYQPPMVGITAMPPTPGSTASVPVLSQPVIVQQAVAQRTSSPPTVLQPSPSGAQGQALQRPPSLPMTTAMTTAAPLPPAAAPVSVSPAAPSGRPPLPQAQSQVPLEQVSQPLPSLQHKQPSGPQASSVQTPQQAVPPVEGRTAAADIAAAELPITLHCPSKAKPQELTPSVPVLAPTEAREQQGHSSQQQQQQPGSLEMQSADAQEQLPPPAVGGQLEVAPSVQGLQQQPQQQEGQPQTQVGQQQQSLAEKPKQPSGPNAAEPQSSAAIVTKASVESSAKLTSKTEEAVATAAAGLSVEAPPTESAVVQTANAGGSGAAEQTAQESTANRSDHPLPNAAAGQLQRGATKQDSTPATAASTTAGNGGAANLAAATGAAATAAAATTEAQTIATGTSGAVPAAVAALTSQAQPLAMSVGASSGAGPALLSNSAAAAMLAQSPAMSMQFLTSMQGLGGGAGTGGSNNALTAAATSILLAAAAAASAGGQNAANNLMGNARTSALQQLAAGTPAAQVFANAAAAAAAAAAAGGSVGGLAQQGKQQPPLFSTAAAAAAAAASSRGIPLASALQSQATGGIGGLGGLGGIGGLPAAFQSLQGFPQSLAGFNLNLAAGGGVGLGLQTCQRLTDGLAGMGIMAQGPHHLQAHHHLHGVQLPAAAQPRQTQTQGQGQQQAGQAEGGRGAGRGRRASRTTVMEEEDEDWEDDDDEEEEAASPSARTRRSARAARRGSNGVRGLDNHGNGGPEGATRQPRRRAAKGAHNWAVLLASESSEEEDGDEEWGARNGRRAQEGGGRGRGRGRRSAG